MDAQETIPRSQSTVHPDIDPPIPISRRARVQGKLRSLTKRQWAILAVVVVAVITLIVLFFVFNNKVKDAIQPVALRIKDLPNNQGYVIAACLVLAASIPPMVGFSAFCTMSGFIFGFPMGVLPCAFGAWIGAVIVFGVVRHFKCTTCVDRLVLKDDRLMAFAEAIKEGSLVILLLIRLSPFPFSYGSALFGLIHTVKFWQFALATFVASWKLFVEVWLGSQLATLTEGTTTSTKSKVTEYVYLFVGAVLFLIAGFWLYRVTNKRVQEIRQRKAADPAWESQLDMELAQPSHVRYDVAKLDDDERDSDSARLSHEPMIQPDNQV